MNLKNPYINVEGYNCFGCAPQNPLGLKLKFELQDDCIVSFWSPENNYQGFYQILHGGIIATLVDEIAGWVVQVLCKTAGVTSEMKVKYLKPVATTKGPVKLEAYINEIKGKFADIEVNLYNVDNELCSKSTVTYYLFSEEVAKSEFNYQGHKSFLDHEI
jgi:uncharacterized protein (TIGR00369 family)